MLYAINRAARAIYRLFKDTTLGYVQCNGSMLAAALSYQMIFSLSPLLILVTSAAGMVFSEVSVIDRLVLEISHTVSPRAAQAVQSLLEAGQVSSSPGVYTTISLGLMLFFASMVFARMKKAINLMWEITSQPGQGMLLFVRTHTLSFLMVMVVVSLFLTFLVVSTTLVSINQWLSINTGVGEPFLARADIGLTYVGFTLLFAIIFKTLPDAQVAWDDTLIGAAFTSTLFTAGEFLIGIYLGRISLRGIYGAMGSLIIVLAWVFYSMQIVLYGAKFTQVYANRYGKKVVPSKKAARVVPSLEIYE
ncbi:MAG: YihY/virulence factor BrkB family protein [Chloroflexota bacterium]